MHAPRSSVGGLFRLILGLLFCSFVLAQGQPESKISSFDNLPRSLLFFDDTDSAIFHDDAQGILYVSLDEGRNWKPAEGVPQGEVKLVVEHPFNNRMGFALTAGKRHYRTEDRGRTWRSFDMEYPLSDSTGRPLSFHSNPAKSGYILYQAANCRRNGFGTVCEDETYYTKEAFSDTPKLLLSDTISCNFAHSRKEFKHDAHEDLIYCVAHDTSSNGAHDLASRRLFSSTDFFQKERKLEDLGIGKAAKGVVAFAVVSKYAVVALKDLSHGIGGEMLLYVTVDTKDWAKAHFPHSTSAKLQENAYTMLESTTHSLAVDVVLHQNGHLGTLFVSNSNGTYFVESLKDTNRNDYGFVDYERIYGVEGIAMANVVVNAQDVESRRAKPRLRTMITFNDGRTWQPVKPPTHNINGQPIKCDTRDLDKCSLHFHSVTSPHNFGRIFSSPAPGFVMGVGSTGESLSKYTDSDTFLSIDGGLNWRMVSKDAHKYEFGDLGSILVMVNDEEPTNEVRYSLDLGKSWKTYDFGVKIRARGLITLPDSTSQKFLLLGDVSRKDQKNGIGKVVVVFLDFSKTRGRKCGNDDYERWYAREGDSECLMGHKQWYKRRKTDVDCYVGEKFNDPVVHEEACKCTDKDYECDYNFIRSGNECVPSGPEKIPAGVCTDPNQTYLGSPGYRKIPGNTCEGGVKKDEKVSKKCSQAQPQEGEIVSHAFDFSSPIVQHAYFRDSSTILVRLKDSTMWQSQNEGYTWTQLFPKDTILAFYHHKYSNDRAYLITNTDKFYYTTDTGRNWHSGTAPNPPQGLLQAQILQFHPTSDYLIWIGQKNCDSRTTLCHTEAHFSRDNGRKWTYIESHVRNCAFLKDTQLDADPTTILCESYADKKKDMRGMRSNPMELVAGSNFYQRKKRMFEAIVGFAKFSEFLIVAELLPNKAALEIQVSLDGNNFALGKFPPTVHPETHAYTILESTTKALFLHMTLSDPNAPAWGTILKSNSNGTYFGVSIDHVNRNQQGYVDFEKMNGLDGIALINIVSNPKEAIVSKNKLLQTRITHNDGGTWEHVTPPLADSLGNKYACSSAKCSLHFHGYTERRDPRATYSSPAIAGFIMAVGNVGDHLKPYVDSDTFLSRDGGFTWEEVHKDAHMWGFGDSGALLILVNDEEPTDFLLYTTDEGLSWHEYKFTDKKMRVGAVVTVTTDTSRRFILFGQYPRSQGSVAVHVDFSALTSIHCQISVDDPGHDDFELWSPSSERMERCLFGRQTLYHRRIRNKNCIVGKQPKAAATVVQNCECSDADFECEFNHVRDASGNCVLEPGTQPLPSDDSICRTTDSDYWYERTPYRIIPYSSCEGGKRPDRGKEHPCPGFKSKGAWFWLFMLFLPFGFTALVGLYYYRKSGLARGTIRLPGGVHDTPSYGRYGGDSTVLDTLASVPWFVVGVAGIAFERVSAWAETTFFSSRRGYRNLPIDEDAQVLRFEDEE